MPEFHVKATASGSKEHFEAELTAEITGDSRKTKQAGRTEGGKDKCSDEVSTRSSKQRTAEIEPIAETRDISGGGLKSNSHRRESAVERRTFHSLMNQNYMDQRVINIDVTAHVDLQVATQQSIPVNASPMANRRISGANRSFGEGALASPSLNPELLERRVHKHTGSKGSFSTPKERVPRQRVSEIIVNKQQQVVDNKQAYYSNP